MPSLVFILNFDKMIVPFKARKESNMSEPNQNPNQKPDLNPSDENGKIEAVPLTETSKTIRKLDNFWYHYKWTVIVVVFFVSVVVVCLVQLFTRPKYDTSMVMITTYRMNSEEFDTFESLVQNLLPEDYDDNGKKRVNVIIYQYYSPAEIEAEKEAAAERETDAFLYNAQYNNSELSAFTNLTMTGEASVCIVSPDVYARLAEKDRLMPIAELYSDGSLPKGIRSDGLGLDLKYSDFYNYHSIVQKLPDTSILCLLRPTVRGNSSKPAYYEREKAFFRAIADFSVNTSTAPSPESETVQESAPTYEVQPPTPAVPAA